MKTSRFIVSMLILLLPVNLIMAEGGAGFFMSKPLKIGTPIQKDEDGVYDLKLKDSPYVVTENFIVYYGQKIKVQKGVEVIFRNESTICLEFSFICLNNNFEGFGKKITFLESVDLKIGLGSSKFFYKTFFVENLQDGLTWQERLNLSNAYNNEINTYFEIEIDKNKEYALLIQDELSTNEQNGWIFSGNLPELSVSSPIKVNAVPRDKKAIVSWKAGQQIGYDLSGYHIYQKNEVGFLNKINQEIITDTSYVVENLENWKTYYFSVVSVDIYGKTSDFSTVAFVTPYSGPYFQFDEPQKVSNTTGYKTNPAIYDNRIVWEDNRDGNTEIYLYDYKTKQEKNLSSNLSQQYSPDIYQDKIIWLDNQNIELGTNIYMYDLSTDTESFVLGGLSGQYSAHNPQIFNDKIVWQEVDRDVSSVKLYNMETSNTQQLSSDYAFAFHPQIYNNKVVWKQFCFTQFDECADSKSNGVYLYDLDSTKNQPEALFYNLSGMFYPKIQDNFIWLSVVNNSNNLYKYDLETKQNKLIIEKENRSDYNVYGNKIVWIDQRHYEYADVWKYYYDVYLYDQSTNNEYLLTYGDKINFQPDIYKDLIVWSEISNTSTIMSQRVFSIPNAPDNLTADGTNPSQQKSITEFEIKWQKPFDPIGIKGAWYKLGNMPKSNEDGVFTTDLSFKINATTTKESLYMWLENLEGYKDYNNNASVILNYVSGGSSFVSGGGGGGGGGGSQNNFKTENKVKQNEAETKKEEQKSKKIEAEKVIVKGVSYEDDARVAQMENIEMESINIINNSKKIENKKEIFSEKQDILFSNNKKEKLSSTDLNIINNFIASGTESTKFLGEGERLGVLFSYQQAFNSLPKNQADWIDCLAIASGRWPKQVSLEAQVKAKTEFEKIYLRSADMSNPHDSAAVTIMAYGLRSAKRNINSEKNAIKIFKDIKKHLPKTTQDWDLLRAIAYSGATR